ncbi:SDR family NAD(P)-dependent oxidoreductase [Bradyrhizobium sp. CCBAU 21360]|uniref:SDR family NAD(P)-dependent oxidoreductase n=1 Tax=Bradyrhizobium sp. CCBAU 21360 TaxID=1325081 RepID=UPI0023066D8B|nr:SDR family NAD(P)-dependent oxidoreductase [Bradyrhizobium sp. CCBAU 21360]MDA9448316.1 3-oxoacyl-ACP reductase [Bradyrhizobium sp. CCBAU 21360]
MNKIDLSGKHAVVTGGSSGIGAAVVRALAAAEATVTVMARKRTHSAEEAEMYDDPKVDFIELDVSDSKAVTRVFADVAAWKGIDISVLSAGLLLAGKLLDTDDETWRRTMAVNLDGLFYTTRESIRHMMAQGRGGKVVSIGSISGYRGNQGFAAYCTSKGGALNFTRQVAMDYAAHGINVNAVAPGFIYTPMTDIYDKDTKAKLAAQTPDGKWGTSQQIADAVMFLSSSLADHIHGQSILVDGGWTLGVFAQP